MTKRTLYAVSATILAVAFAGCHNTHGPASTAAHSESPITSAFKAAGGGDPSAADEKGIALFLNNHPETSRALTAPCTERAKSANATWTQTAEGKICTIAGQVVSMRNFYGLDAPTPATNSDKRTYSPIPGKK